MKTSLTTACMMVLSMGAATGLAHAEVGESFDGTGIEIMSKSGSCPVRGALCVTSGARSTITSAPVTEGRRLRQAAVTQEVTRSLRVAARGGATRLDGSTPWTIQFDANLRQPALRGNALFLVFDTADKHAIANRQVTAMWQAPVPAGSSVAAKMTLSPDEGFHAGHTYRVRVVQIIQGKEVKLAEGDVRLL